MSKNTDSEISQNLKARFDVNYIYVKNHKHDSFFFRIF